MGSLLDQWIHTGYENKQLFLKTNKQKRSVYGTETRFNESLQAIKTSPTTLMDSSLFAEDSNRSQSDFLTDAEANYSYENNDSLQSNKSYREKKYLSLDKKSDQFYFKSSNSGSNDADFYWTSALSVKSEHRFDLLADQSTHIWSVRFAITSGAQMVSLIITALLIVILPRRVVLLMNVLMASVLTTGLVICKILWTGKKESVPVRPKKIYTIPIYILQVYTLQCTLA